MRINERDKGLQLAQSALSEMRARLALLNTAISALQHYQGQSDEGDTEKDAREAAPAGSRPFLVPRRDTRAEKAS
jgi:hypothetical protein